MSVQARDTVGRFRADPGSDAIAASSGAYNRILSGAEILTHEGAIDGKTPIQGTVRQQTTD